MDPLPESQQYDLVIIGSGPSAQKCAISASKKGKKVCIVDRSSMFGGVCIHTGTVPSKTFREAVLYLTGYRQRGFYGKKHKERERISTNDILDRVKKVEGWETETILDQLQRNHVTMTYGHARFVDEHHIEVVSEGHGPHSTSGENIIRGEHIVIATGTRPAQNPLYDFNNPKIFDADQVLQNKSFDGIRDLIVVGSGVIALEYGSMFNALPGCRVTIVDERHTFLDFVDTECVQTLRYIMHRQGATFRLGEKVKHCRADEKRVVLEMESGNVVSGDALFYAVGRQANTDQLALDNTRVELGNRGIIKVNSSFQTSVPHIYAIGDVIGFPALASTAMEQGRLASLHMFDGQKPQPFIFPYGIYTIPEISVIGKSEQELIREKTPYAIGVAKFSETAKGQMIGQDIDGFLKLLFCPRTHKLFGCHAIGENAAEIIHIGQAVLSFGGNIEYFRDSVFNYPTMAESYRVAALDGLNKLGFY